MGYGECKEKISPSLGSRAGLHAERLKPHDIRRFAWLSPGQHDHLPKISVARASGFGKKIPTEMTQARSDISVV
jgi:hypothetical protein